MDLRPVWQAIVQREQIAAATVHRLREQIAALTEQLARAETELADLATTRRTLTTLTGEPDPTTAGTVTVEPSQTVESTQTVEAVAPSSPTYPQILATFTGTEAMRAKDICLALGLDIIPKNTENRHQRCGSSRDRLSWGVSGGGWGGVDPALVGVVAGWAVA